MVIQENDGIWKMMIFKAMMLMVSDGGDGYNDGGKNNYVGRQNNNGLGWRNYMYRK